MSVAATQLQQIYSRFPSLKTNADRGALGVAAEKVLGAPAAKALLATLADKDTYLSARSTALDGLLTAPPAAETRAPKRAVVSGLSSGGILSAIVLAKSGYQVDAIEQRGGYSRNMQFSSRQGLIDELSSIDPKLGQRFLEISAHFSGGNVFTDQKGKRVEVMRDRPLEGDPTRVPHSGEELLEGAPCSLVECKALEQLLFDYARAMPNVTIHNFTTVQLGGPDDQGRYSVTGTPVKPKDGSTPKPPFDLGKPDLVVVSEGAGSATRKQLGITSAVTSPERRFIGGVVDQGLGGKGMSRRDDVKNDDGSIERLVTMALGSAKLDRTWVIAGVAKDFNLDPGGGLDPTSAEYRTAQQALIEAELRKEAALVMELPNDGVAVHGPIEGTRPTLFTLQQHMSDKATAGSNVVGLGDFVGNGHFTVGGGMATATVSHIERLKSLVFDLEAGVDKGAALAKYDQGALEDTMAWGRRGINEFYPDVDRKVVSAAYVQAIADWRAGKNKDPLAALEKILYPVSEALPAIGKVA